MPRLTMQRMSVVMALLGMASPAALALTHAGGASIGADASVKLYDASNPEQPILTEETESLTQSGSFVFSHDALFLASGHQVRRYDSQDLSAPAVASWTAAGTVLAVADGPERGLVLVLDGSSLNLVSFPDGGTPTLVWTYPVNAAAGATNPGRILIRDGNRAFVADASLPGVRVVSLDGDSAPTTITTYASADGSVHEMSLWGGKLTLATDTALVVVSVSAGDAPTLTRIGARLTDRVPTRVDANSKFALVADGSGVTVVDVDPASPTFLGGALDGWQAQSDVRSIRLDKKDRAYVLVDGAYEILDVASFGGR